MPGSHVGGPGIGDQRHHLVVGGQPDRVIPAATIDESHSTGAPAASAACALATTSSL